MLRPAIAAALLAASVAALPAWGQVRVGGAISTAFQLRLTGCESPETCRFLNFRNANVVRLNIDAQPSSSTELFADVSIRNINFTRIETLDDAGDIAKVQPVDIRVNEARLALFDLFGAKGLDLSAGALRVAWGTADGVNPLDVVNPYDLEEGSAYDQRLTSLAVQLAWSAGPVRLEAVAVPIFLPSILPVDNIDFTTLGPAQDALDLTDDDDTPAEIRKVATPTETPAASLSNVQTGVRLKVASPIGDWSAVFYRGFESIPQASGEVRLTGLQTANRIDLSVPLVYPRVLIGGLDYRGNFVGSFGGWFEVALIHPEQHSVTASRTQLEQLVKLGSLDEMPDPIPTQLTQRGAPYLKAVAGLEVIVADQLYLNLQYARGMPTERQWTDIHDYVLLAARWSLLDGRLVIGARGALELGEDWEPVGYQAGGRIAWIHGDAAQVSLGVTFLGGDDSAATFGRFRDLSHAKLGLSLSF